MNEQPPAAQPAAAQIIETRTAIIRLDRRGILWVVINKLDHQLSDAHDNLAASVPLLGSARPPLVVDLRQAGLLSADARTFYAGAEAAKYHCARAILIGSPVSRVLATLMISFSKPATPTKAFTNEADAIAWLAQFQSEAS